MKNIRLFRRGAVFTFAFAVGLMAGCGDARYARRGTDGSGGADGASSSGSSSSSGSASGTSGSGSSSSSGGSGSSGSSGSSSGAGGAGGAGGSMLDCAQYCAQIVANCAGPNAQFTDMDSCMGVCAAYPPGDVGDTLGDSLQCRLYHSGAAAADPPIHCAHAGPTGGDANPTDAQPGVCGEGCAAFCEIAAKACTGGSQQFASQNACLAECKTFAPSVMSYSVLDTSADDFGCRMYHLSVAASSPAAAQLHCPHIRAASATCTN